MKHESFEFLAQLVGKLNSEVAKQTESQPVILRPFRLETDGEVQAITFFGMALWNSDEDERIWADVASAEEAEELEPLEDFIRREIEPSLNSLKAISYARSS